MPTTKFQPSPNREAAKQALREGMTPKECALKFPITERTAWRYLKEVREGPAKPHEIKEGRSKPVRITLEMGSKDFAKLLALLGHQKDNRPIQ